MHCTIYVSSALAILTLERLRHILALAVQTGWDEVVARYRGYGRETRRRRQQRHGNRIALGGQSWETWEVTKYLTHTG